MTAPASVPVQPDADSLILGDVNGDSADVVIGSSLAKT
jgi:hypothetical protein